jgi:hypothetical protein
MSRRDSGLGRAVWHAAAAYRITSMAVPFPVFVAMPMHGTSDDGHKGAKRLSCVAVRTLLFMSGCDPWNNGSADSKRVHERGLIFSTTDKRLQHFWHKNRQPAGADLLLPAL